MSPFYFSNFIHSSMSSKRLGIRLTIFLLTLVLISVVSLLACPSASYIKRSSVPRSIYVVAKPCLNM